MKIWPWSKFRELDKVLTDATRENERLRRRVEWFANENKRLAVEHQHEKDTLEAQLSLAERRAKDIQGMLVKEQADKVELRRRIRTLEQKQKAKET